MGLIFDGVDLEERFGLVTDGADTWTKPERDRELISVPGRNGDLILDHGRWNNVDIKYNFLIKDGWQNKFEEFARWLCAHRGYFKLEDPHRHPDVYRMAEFADSIDPKLWFTTRTGIFTLTFNCKPQQFLYSGDRPLQRIIPNVVAHTWTTNYLPVAGNHIRIKPKLDSDVTGSITISIVLSDSDKNVITTWGPIAVSNMLDIDYTISHANAAYWQITVNANSATNNDKISFTIVAKTVVNGETIDLNAVLARKFTYTNETGYESKPYIVFYDTSIMLTISNKDSNGVRQDFYSLNISDYSSLTDIAILDCEMQYLYYNHTDEYGFTTKKNLGAYLFISDSKSAAGKALSFPTFGPEKIDVVMYTSLDGLGYAEIYPRWWRV